MAKLKVTATVLRLHPTPAAGAPVTGRVTKGELVTPLDRAGVWWQVRTANGVVGWGHSDYLRGTGWRVAKSLLQLRRQCDTKAPHRNDDWDGSIGDEKHQERQSDHNPIAAPADTLDPTPVVCATDTTHDPKGGLDMAVLTENLRLSRDPRIKYVIYDHRMFSSIDTAKGPAWVWRSYDPGEKKGGNPHEHHAHVSVVADPKLYDNETPWRI